MEAISGVFKTREDAERAVKEVRAAAIPAEKVTLLTPGTTDKIDQELESVPVDTSEQSGMGKTFGAILGGAAGLSGGSLLIALVPGLGPITAIGMLGAAILGAAGATIGASAGGKLENSMSRGLPEDEIFVYEDALRKGRSVVIALSDSEGTTNLLRDILKAEGAETIDAARDQWWIGLRSAEENHYATTGKNFTDDEKFYRLGFEAALHARTRCMEFDQVSAEMSASLEDIQRQYPDAKVEDPYTRGYQRGREYYQQLCDESKAA
ncbi:MAG TPA: hypothetical protein VLK33_19350 [Terriglobales bacterium]|nr:hypothetical protein [Terriglobales bacterium]